MDFNREIYHPNDVTIKYLINRIPDKLHHYFNLPGKFVRNFPVGIVKPDGGQREMDWLILVKPDFKTLFEDILINVEFQTLPVDGDKMEAIADYCDFGKFCYGRAICSVVVIGEGFELSEKEYRRVISDILRPQYIHLDWGSLSEKLNNLENKILNHEKLSDDEALDMVFISMYAPKKYAEIVTERIVELFCCDKSLEDLFQVYIVNALSFMVIKYFGLNSKGRRLLAMLEDQYVDKNAIRDVVDFKVEYTRRLYEKQLEENEKALIEKDNVISEKNEAIIEKDNVISEKNEAIIEKDKEIALLKAKLAEANGD